MWTATIEVPELSGEVIEHLAEALVRINVSLLRDRPYTPPLYQARVQYRGEHATERWATIPVVQERGYGDCEDLAAWLCAERRMQGDVGSRVIWCRRRRPDGSWLYHVLVQHGSGVIEDPSLKLGM